MFKQGDIGESFYVIYKGSVKMSAHTEDSPEHFLATLQKGEKFGLLLSLIQVEEGLLRYLLHLINNNNKRCMVIIFIHSICRTYTATTCENTTLLKIEKADYDRLLKVSIFLYFFFVIVSFFISHFILKVHPREGKEWEFGILEKINFVKFHSSLQYGKVGSTCHPETIWRKWRLIIIVIIGFILTFFLYWLLLLVVYKKGEETDGLYFIRNGTCKILQEVQFSIKVYFLSSRY